MAESGPVPADRTGATSPGRATLVVPDDPEWNKTLAALPHDSYHLPGYVSLEADRSEGQATLFVYEEQHDQFAVPFVLRSIPGTDLRDAGSPYGYPGPLIGPAAGPGFVRRAAEALRTTLREERVVSYFVRMNPLLPVDHDALAVAGTVTQHGHTVNIDLSLSEEQHRQQLRENHRRQIVGGRRRGITVSFDDWGRVGEFVEIYHETMRRVHATDYYFFPASYFTALREAIDEQVHLVLLDLPGESVAIGGGIFFEECGIVQYHLGATRTEHLRHQPTKLMFEKVREWGKQRGNRALHLGGGVQLADGTNPLFHFKQGFSRDVRPFHTWRGVLDPHTYSELTRSRAPGVDPGDISGFFPAYRRVGGRA